MDYRGSKSEFRLNSVKEQRVDGTGYNGWICVYYMRIKSKI